MTGMTRLLSVAVCCVALVTMAVLPAAAAVRQLVSGSRSAGEHVLTLRQHEGGLNAEELAVFLQTAEQQIRAEG